MASKAIVLATSFFTAILLITPVLGGYTARVFAREKTWLDPLMRPAERAVYRLCGIDEAAEMTWSEYALAMLGFQFVGMVALYAIQRLQGVLPFNPEHLGSVPPALALNTAASFVSNTDWQAYAGESTMSYFTQMAGLAYQCFASGATGLAVGIAVIRGFARRCSQSIGNFWVDLTRAILWVLFPLSIPVALLLVWQGVPQNLSPYVHALTLERARQVIPQGPVASQTAIDYLGTNGSGFFNAIAAHPYQNPTPLTNLIALFSVVMISAALPYTLGVMVGDKRQGWTLLAAMILLALAGIAAITAAERSGNPLLARAGVCQAATAAQPAGNMEGKEVRFGIVDSALFADLVTATGSGSPDAMHDSFTPLSGLVMLFNMGAGELIFGGVGVGLVGMVFMALLAVFIAGLMVGRTPEYLGKKIQAREMKLTVLYLIAPSAVALVFAAAAAAVKPGLSSIGNPGPHGLTEILYAFMSGAANNGSAFAGLNANTVFYNLTLAMDMLIGRYFTLIPALALAGAMAEKKTVPPSAGTLPTSGVLFVVLLIGVVVLFAMLTFFSPLALGPIAEHLAMRAGRLFH